MTESAQPTAPALLDLIPVTAECVLALDDENGTLSAAWQERCPNGRWVAITAADASEDGSLEARLDGARPDCLLLDGSMERASDPAALLQRIVPGLQDSAAVIATFANSGHWSVIGGLLQDRWNNADEALPGKDRQRFFTLRRARSLLTDAGLQPTKVVRLPDAEGETPQRDRVIAAAEAAAGPLGLDPEALRERLATASYAVVAVKGESSPALYVHQLVMVPRFMSVRTEQPMAALNSLPNVSTTSSIKTLTLPKLPRNSDKVLIIQRQIVLDPEGWTEQIKALSKQGWTLIAEWDDHPDLLPGAIKAKWDLNPWLPMRAVHAVQTSTPLLAEVFKAYNPNVAVFENALFAVPPRPQKSQRHFRIIFAALNREDVNPWLAPLLNRVMRDHPQTQIAIVHNRALHDALEVSEDRKSFREQLSYPNYLKAIGGAHVALLPLAGTEAERYKSDVKFIECASRGTVCIASPLLYEDRIVDGERGLIAREPEQWEAALRQLVEDSAAREGMAAAAYAYCREERMLATQTKARLAWYRDLCSRQASLHEELMRRLAG